MYFCSSWNLNKKLTTKLQLAFPYSESPQEQQTTNFTRFQTMHPDWSICTPCRHCLELTCTWTRVLSEQEWACNGVCLESYWTSVWTLILYVGQCVVGIYNVQDVRSFVIYCLHAWMMRYVPMHDDRLPPRTTLQKSVQFSVTKAFTVAYWPDSQLTSTVILAYLSRCTLAACHHV